MMKYEVKGQLWIAKVVQKPSSQVEAEILGRQNKPKPKQNRPFINAHPLT